MEGHHTQEARGRPSWYQGSGPVRTERPMEWMQRARRAEEARLDAQQHALLLQDRREEARRRRARETWSPEAIARDAVRGLCVRAVRAVVVGVVLAVGALGLLLVVVLLRLFLP